MVSNVVDSQRIHMVNIDRLSASETLIGNGKVAKISGNYLLPDVFPLSGQIEVLIDPSFGAECLSTDSAAKPQVSIAL